MEAPTQEAPAEARASSENSPGSRRDEAINNAQTWVKEGLKGFPEAIRAWLEGQYGKNPK